MVIKFSVNRVRKTFALPSAPLELARLYRKNCRGVQIKEGPAADSNQQGKGIPADWMIHTFLYIETTIPKGGNRGKRAKKGENPVCIHLELD